MKKIRLLMTSFVVSALGLALFLFQNFTQSVEVFYQAGTGIPISEIALATPGPQVSKNLTINADEIVYLDHSLEVDQLTINGQLHCDPVHADKHIEIKARVIYVNGLFQCGQSAAPYQKNVTISLKPGSVDPKTSVAYRGMIVNNGGKLILNGNRRRSNWLKLAQTITPGQNFLVLDQPLLSRSLNWSIGDEIVVGPTSYKPSESETFRITDIQGNTIYINGSFLYKHAGQKETYITTYNGTVQFDPRAEVANLTRNILIRADESTGVISSSSAVGSELGGHVMVMYGGQAYVDSVEFSRMGQAGVMARYPFHWHVVGNAPGQFIKNSSIHDSFQRCVTVHATNQASVINNVCSNFKGHGFFLEDGNEIDNTVAGNLAINAKFPHYSKRLLASDSTIQSDAQGRFSTVSSYWISNPKNKIYNNVASGSVGSGFWMAFEDEIKDNQGNVVARPVNEVTTQFENNVAHSMRIGFTWDGAPNGGWTGNPNNPNDHSLSAAYYKPTVVPVFKKLTAFKNTLSGIYFRGYTAVYDGNVTADNGWHYWLAYNQIIKNAVVIGRSQNFSTDDQVQAMIGTNTDRHQQVAVIQYDGPFELNGVDFMNYPTQKIYHNTTDVTPFAIGTTGGTERLTNTSKRVHFGPEPYHRTFMKDNTALGDLGGTGNNSLRDEDGTMSGVVGGNLVGKNSLGILPSSNCVSGGTKHNGFKKCPGSYTEAYLTLFDGIGNTNPWGMPFLARRSDGALSTAMNYWQDVIYNRRGGNKVALANSMTVEYELMIANLKWPRLWVTAESPNAIIPVTKVVAQGKNCRLDNIPAVNSLNALKAATSSAYFTQGDDIYFRLIPKINYQFIIPFTGHGTARSYNSEGTNISCDGDVTPVVKGYVDYVVKENNDAPVKVIGWACNFSKDVQINVKLAVKATNSISRPLVIKTILANKTSEPAVAFACGVPNTTAFRYEFSVPKSEAILHGGKKVYVYGVSTTGGTDLALAQSGQFSMPFYSSGPSTVQAPSY